MARNCCSTESVWKKAHKREGCAHSNLAFILSDICITVFFKIQAVYHYNYFCLSCTLCSFTISTTALFVIWGFKQQKNPNNKKNIKSIWHREPVDNNLGITISLRLACYLALPFKNAILQNEWNCMVYIPHRNVVLKHFFRFIHNNLPNMFYNWILHFVILFPGKKKSMLTQEFHWFLKECNSRC